jgi:hypothetical protein
MRKMAINAVPSAPLTTNGITLIAFGNDLRRSDKTGIFAWW